MSLKRTSDARLALVIGNSAYTTSAPLPNAANDAALVATELRSVGVEVHQYQNLDRTGMDRAIEKFEARLASLKTAETAIFFFSGHGLQDERTNYLLPCESKGPPQPVNLQEWIDRITKNSRRRLVFLDACRSYFDAEPIQNEMVRTRGLTEAQRPEVHAGLADFETADDTFISFSAAPGEPAYDGVHGRKNSPYAEALGRFFQEVDLPLTVMMVRVRNSVRQDTEHIRNADGEPTYQKTWDTTSLRSGFFFNPSSLLFLFGNALALLASVVALLTFAVVLYEAAVLEFSTERSHRHWVLLTLFAFLMTLAVFLFGVGRAYARVRGEQPDWQREGAFLLFKWSTAGSFGALGGMLGGVIASAFVIVPYWYEWRTDTVTDWIVNAQCPQFHWAHHDMPTTCPKLGLLLAEGALSGIFILTTLGFLATHFIEWMIRGWPARFFNKGHAMHVLAGAMIGGALAGFIVGPLITAYFGSYSERPFLAPNFAIPFAVAAVAITAFSISNYSLETFTPARLRRSAVGAVLGTIAAGILLGSIIGLLYLSGFVDAALLWAGKGFFDFSLPTLQRYSYLLIVGLPYGMVFGLSFGVLIAVTRIMTDRHRQDDIDHPEPQTPHRSAP